MQLELKKYFFDIKESIEAIDAYLGDQRDFNAYQENKMLRRAVERELEIIGEAASRILKINPDIDIANARKIVDLRNWVIHGYDKIDDVIIWGIVSKHLPELKAKIDLLLNSK
jgi:uncharacterized protein with HEPN domain